MSKELEMARELVRILEEKERGTKVELSTLVPGEIFEIGEYDFIVLEQCDGQTKVISKKFMANDVKFDKNTRDYKESSLKKMIESDIQSIIEDGVGAENIIEHELALTSVDMQNEFGICKCKVRLVTFDEARKYNALLVNEELNAWWWTCTPWSRAGRGWDYSIAVVSPAGDVFNYSCSNRNGVRPFCILKSNIFVSKGE